MRLYLGCQALTGEGAQQRREDCTAGEAIVPFVQRDAPPFMLALFA